MNINKKGITLVELLGVIVILAILAGLAVYSMNYVIGTGKVGLYRNYEETLKAAAHNYFIDNPGDIPKTGYKKINITTLEDYLDELKDPNAGDCANSENLSYVYVLRGADGTDKAKNIDLTYYPCLKCISKTDNSLLYKSDNDYCS